MKTPSAIRSIQGIIGFVLVLLVFPAISQTTNAPGNSAPPAPVQSEPESLARDLIGKRAQSKRGEELGVVTDVLIDVRSGRVEYVVISAGGFAGMVKKLKPVPPQSMSLATAKRGVVSVDITPARWKSAPTFTKAGLANLVDPEQVLLIERYYPTAATRNGRPVDAERVSLESASTLVGKDVINHSGRKAARISDLLINLGQPDVAFAILRPLPGTTVEDKGISGQSFAVPVRALTIIGRSVGAVVELSPVQFQNAEPLVADIWTANSLTNKARIYRYQAAERVRGGSPQR